MDDDEARNWTWIIQQGRNHKKKSGTNLNLLFYWYHHTSKNSLDLYLSASQNVETVLLVILFHKKHYICICVYQHLLLCR